MQSEYKPSLISWNLTKHCNLRCPHCYMEGGRKAENELTTQECLDLIVEMKALGTEMLILTGGEPLLRKDIFDIARSASSQGIWVVMGTNGVLVTDKVVGKMIECGVQGVAISIDSVDPEKHNQFRGGPESWEHSVRALEICRSNGLQVLVQTTVMEMNYAEIPELLAFAREKGAWSFNLYFLVQTGRGQKIKDLSPERTESMLSNLVDWQDEYRPMLVRSKCAPQFKQIAYDRGMAGLESGGCMAGTQYCRIAPEGDVYQAGTLSGNPLAVAAGIATLELLEEPAVYTTLAERSKALTAGLAERAEARGVLLTTRSIGGMFGFFFHPGPVDCFAQAQQSDAAAFRRFFKAMLEEGVYLAPSPYEAGFVSLAHRPRDIARTLESARRALARVARAR